MPFRRYGIPAEAEDFSYNNGMVYYTQAGTQHEATVTNDVSFSLIHVRPTVIKLGKRCRIQLQLWGDSFFKNFRDSRRCMVIYQTYLNNAIIQNDINLLCR